MPRRPPDEDLFKDTTMSFGEHLEELRKALFKAVLWLVVGVAIGLTVADKVVDYIQTPLSAALMRYFAYDAEQLAEAKVKELETTGQALPDRELLKQRVKNQFLPEFFWVDRRQLTEDLGLPSPEKPEPPEGTPASVAGDEDLVPVFLYRPAAEDPRIRARSLSAGEPFTIWLKAGLLVGAVLASPFVFYQIWNFVAAGLYPHEKRYVHVYLPFSLGLFLAGAATAFLFALGPVLDFLLSFNRWMGISPDLRISEWLSFVLLLPLGFGISFQLPLVMLFLERIRILTVASYTSRWRVSVLVIFVLSMVCTPGDPYSMLLMAITLTFLYFFGILLCLFMPRRKSQFEDLEAYA